VRFIRETLAAEAKYPDFAIGMLALSAYELCSPLIWEDRIHAQSGMANEPLAMTWQ
jgi:hypothetical protein